MLKNISKKIQHTFIFLSMISFLLLSGMKKKPLILAPAKRITQDVFQEILLPHLDLLEVSHFGQTCKIYNNYCSFEKICMLPPEIPAANTIQNNYFYSTCVLSYIAQKKHAEKNKKKKKIFKTVFSHVWNYHADLRNTTIPKPLKKRGRKNVSITEIYRKQYKTVNQIRMMINQQLKNAILNDDEVTVNTIMQNNNYRIFDLFNADEIADAIHHLCQICFKKKSNLILAQLTQHLTAEEKSYIRQEIFTFHTDILVASLLIWGWPHEWNWLREWLLDLFIF